MKMLKDIFRPFLQVTILIFVLMFVSGKLFMSYIYIFELFLLACLVK
jgi:hypothetical protein